MSPDQLYFTADTHFGHTNAATLWRPFASVEMQDEFLIERWNAKVGPTDTVWHLGDVGFFRDAQHAGEILFRLNGHIHLVAGNHDDALLKWIKRGVLPDPFATIQDMKYLKVRTSPGAPRQKIHMTHYPMVTWRSSAHGSWHLHGHCHGNLDESRLPKARRLDVGVDPMKFVPVSYYEVEAMMQDLWLDPVDHHTPRED